MAMAKAPTNSAEAQRDEVPPLDDDIEPAEQAEARDDADDSAGQDAEPVEKAESPREAAVRRYRELRAQREAAASGDTSEDADDSDEQDDPEPAPARAQPQKVEPESADEPEFEVKVHGQTKKLKASELVAKAQIALASENILDEVKSLKRDMEARAQRGRSSDPADQQDEDDGLNAQEDDRSPKEPAKANQRKPVLDAEKLEDIVERIQIGDKAEGRAALSELIDAISGSAPENSTMKPEEIGRVVTEQIARARFKSEIEEATGKFRQEYAGVVSDPDVLDASLRRLSAELRQDVAAFHQYLSAAGMAPGNIDNLSTDQLLEFHQQARIAGYKTRGYSQILDKVGKEVSQKFGAILPSRETSPTNRSQQPTPSASLNERVDRKRSAPVQPRTAGVRASDSQPKPKSRADVIAEMRRSRGYA